MHVQVSLTIEISATASLTQMEEQIQQAGQQAMREALKQTIRQREDQRPTCPHCGQKWRRLEGTVRRSIATTLGRVMVPRRRFRCQGGGRRWCPANRLLSELKGGTISQPLQEAAMLAGCSWPYRAASSLSGDPRGGTRQAALGARTRLAVVPASHVALLWPGRSSRVRLAHLSHRSPWRGK